MEEEVRGLFCCTVSVEWRRCERRASGRGCTTCMVVITGGGGGFSFPRKMKEGEVGQWVGRPGGPGMLGQSCCGKIENKKKKRVGPRDQMG
jgi:hypothetical protein